MSAQLRPSSQVEPAPDAGALFHAFADALRSFLRSKTGDPATAEDLVQEVFLRVHRDPEGLREGERVAGWLFQIARRVLADHYRRGPGRADTQNAADAEHHLGLAIDEESDLQAEGEALQIRQLGLWLAATIGVLPEPYREALTLVELQGLTQKEAADRLGLSCSGLKSRVQRGRALLRESLVRCCHVELDRSGRVIESTVQTDLIGPVNFKALTETGRTEHFTDEGMLGAVHALLDEVFDGRDMLLRSALNVLQERELKAGSSVLRLPKKLSTTASS